MRQSPYATLNESSLRDVCGLCRGDWLQQAEIGVFVADVQRVHYVNPHLAAVFGYTPEEICGRLAPADLVSAEFRAAVEVAIVNCLRGEPSGSARFFDGRCKDGSLVPVEAVGTPTTLRGAPTVIGLVIDHSERRRAESALQDQHDFTAQLIEAIPSPIFFKDTAGCYLGGNRAFERFIGRPRESFVGRSVHDISAKELADVYAAADQALFDQPGTQTYETEVDAADGSRRQVVFNKATFRRANAEIGGLVGIILDVTERRRTEKELFESQAQLRSLTARLESVREEERTRISREIHDELGQTLTGLKMDLAWLHGQLRQDQQTLADKVTQMSVLVDVTVQTVRKISWELRPSPLDSLGLVAAIEWLARDFQMRNGIRCRVKTPAEQPQIEDALATSVFRILQELLTNVTRHAAASAVEVQFKVAARTLTLIVKDNGKGMPATVVTAQSLGLLGVRERARHFGGEVAISSRPEVKGTKVTVLIPRTQLTAGFG